MKICGEEKGLAFSTGTWAPKMSLSQGLGTKTESVSRALKVMAGKDPSKLAWCGTHCRQLLRPITSNPEKGLNKVCMHSHFNLGWQ